MSARRLRLADRGELHAGHVADVVVFDPERVRDTASFESPGNSAKASRRSGSTAY